MSTTLPDDRRYSREHEWVRVEGSVAVIGITSFAADELGDIVYVELPETRGERSRSSRASASSRA